MTHTHTKKKRERDMRKVFQNNFDFLLQAQIRSGTTLKAGTKLKGNLKEMVMLKKTANRKSDGISHDTVNISAS